MTLPVDAPGPAALLEGLPPVIDRHTRLVLLGSFPGAASLAAGQYYAHPRNQLWPVLGRVWGLPDLATWPYAERLAELLRRGVGLWDLYARCARQGSLDSAIRAAEPNDLARLRSWAPGLQAIAHNGRESAKGQRLAAALGLDTHTLPSTSPAHAALSLAAKAEAWGAVLRRYDPA